MVDGGSEERFEFVACVECERDLPPLEVFVQVEVVFDLGGGSFAEGRGEREALGELEKYAVEIQTWRWIRWGFRTGGL